MHTHSTDADEWLESFSVRSYHPMVRLAEGADPAFLSGACDARSARRYRREQRVLLREYLRGLSRDFQRLHSIAISRDRSERFSDRSIDLCDRQLSFIFGLFWIEACLAVQALFPRAVRMEPLLDSVDALARSTREMARKQLRFYAA